MPWEPDYVDEPTLIDFVRANADNPYVGTYGTAAARAVDGYCGRQFGKMDVATALTFSAHRAAPMRDGWWHLATEDAQDLTGATVTVDGTTVTAGATGYRWWERNAAAFGRPYTGLLLASQPYGDVVATLKWGWNAVPAAVTAAVWLQVNRWNTRRESPYGIAGSPAEGTEVRLTAVLDPDVRALLAGGRVIRKRMPQ